MVFRKQFVLLFIFVFVLKANGQFQSDSVFVKLNLKWKNETLELNKVYHSKTDSLQISTFKFYVSAIAIQFEDNSAFIEKNSYHLVDLEDENTFKIALFKKANKSISKISFNIGVDSLASISGAMSGDLDAIKGMYWAWQSGFINMKIEGKSSSCATRNNNFHFHVGGYLKPNYALRNVNVNANNNINDNVNLVVDLSKLFDEVDLKTTNSIMIPGQKAMKIANLSVNMFRLQ
jgi:hypothetical protein